MAGSGGWIGGLIPERYNKNLISSISWKSTKEEGEIPGQSSLRPGRRLDQGRTAGSWRGRWRAAPGGL